MKGMLKQMMDAKTHELYRDTGLTRCGRRALGVTTAGRDGVVTCQKCKQSVAVDARMVAARAGCCK